MMVLVLIGKVKPPITTITQGTLSAKLEAQRLPELLSLPKMTLTLALEITTNTTAIGMNLPSVVGETN